MTSNNNTVYVRTSDYYGLELAKQHFTLNKVYKATRAIPNNETSYYTLLDDTMSLRAINLIRCSWLNYNNWEIVSEDDYTKQELTMNNNTNVKRLTRAECFREYARVIEMCEGTGLSAKDCVRIDGEENIYEELTFYSMSEYTFAFRIHEDRPVFEGDTLYYSDTSYPEGLGTVWKASKHWSVEGWKCVSWTKPISNTITFNLNGIELPLPKENGNYSLHDIYQLGWDTIAERDKVKDAIIKLLKGELA